jgi:hypothetical protein
MQPQKNNAGRLRDTGTAKGFQSFGQYSTDEIKKLAKELKEQRLRRDNAARRLPPLRCGCRDPLRCRCIKGSAA